MWYTEAEMTNLTDSIRIGNDTADRAEAFRQDTRWNVKPDAPGRTTDIERHLEQIRLAMEPIRSWVGRAVWGQVKAKDETRLRDVSERLQYQRKQLKKMRR